jgi:hypothetical protein
VPALVAELRRQDRAPAPRLESGEVACEAEFVLGLFDTQRRKLINPTPKWLASVGLSPEDWQARKEPDA